MQHRAIPERFARSPRVRSKQRTHATRDCLANASQNVFADNVAWYKVGGVTPVEGGSTGWRVLIGQFTVPQGKLFGGSGLLSGEGINEYAAFTSAQ